MNKIQLFSKKNAIYILYILLFSLLSFFFIPNIYLALISFSLCFLISSFSFNIVFKLKEKEERKLANLTFLHSFLYSLYLSKSVKESYENAIKYLIGYENIIPYDELLTRDDVFYNLNEYQELFTYVLNKNKINEIYIPNYYYVINELDKKINILQLKLKDSYKNFQVKLAFYLILFFLIGVFIRIIPSNSQIFLNTIYVFLSMVVFALFLSSIAKTYVNKIKR